MQVLFDVDGVLIEPWRFRDLLDSDYGIAPEATRNFFATRFRKCLVDAADLVEELPPFLEAWGWPGTVDEFLRVWFEVENAPNAPVFEFVSRLRKGGWSCHIASNQERRRARYLVEVMGLHKHFESLFFSCDLGASKPDSAYYERIEASLGFAASQLVLVDDSERNVAAARERGWLAFRFDGLESLEDMAVALDGSAS